MKICFLTFTLLLYCGLSSVAQLLQIHGKIIGSDLEALPGVQIYADTVLLANSKQDGTFELTLSKPTEVSFGFIGMHWEDILVSNNCENLEILMLPEPIYHYKSHKKIDRLRKQTFDNRMEFHEQAFENGIFTTPAPCFNYKFVPIKPELDKTRKWIKKKKIVIRKEFNQLNPSDTVYIPYSGPRTNSVHTSFSDYTNYECLITGTVIKKDKKRRGLIVHYKVVNMDNCAYKILRHRGNEVSVGDTIEHNMKYARLITAFSMTSE